jgi:molybdopterin synthase sulfur carrier subunit
MSNATRAVYTERGVPTVAFTKNLERHVECPTESADGATVRAVLDAVFAKNPRLRGYVLDDQGALRHHMMVFVDGQQIVDRARLSDPVRAASEIYVMQALSGGR